MSVELGCPASPRKDGATFLSPKAGQDYWATRGHSQESWGSAASPGLRPLGVLGPRDMLCPEQSGLSPTAGVFLVLR